MRSWVFGIRYDEKQISNKNTSVIKEIRTAKLVRKFEKIYTNDSKARPSVLIIYKINIFLSSITIFLVLDFIYFYVK